MNDLKTNETVLPNVSIFHAHFTQVEREKNGDTFHAVV